MPRVIGPTIPRWELGSRLRDLRHSRDLELGEVATELACSPSKVQKIERGDVGTSRGDLRMLLDLYEVPADQRQELDELRQLSQQRSRWAPLRLPGEFVTYLDLESAAESVRAFEPSVIHGLLQTEEYARANAETSSGPITAEQVDRQVQIRMERQANLADRSGRDGDPLKLWVVLDEAALRRMVGGVEVMRRQLEHLISLPPHRVTLQVVPFDVGGYPGTAGGLAIFDFDPDLHSPVVYVETQTGVLYAERALEVESANVRFSHITAAALSPERTRRWIRDVADTL